MKRISILNTDKERRISLSVHGELEKGVGAMNQKLFLVGLGDTGSYS